MELLGPYVVKKRIGRGGMAEVLLAEDPDGKPVVVKRMLPHLAAEPTYTKMFLREARIAARLNHENVVQLLDVDKDGDDLYLVFDFVDGKTLYELARRAWHNEKPLPVELCLRTIADAAIGLHHAHELKDDNGALAGLVHRDVSPDNLMLDSSGNTHVLDFGIAKLDDTATHVSKTGELRGKLSFMSPEQAQGHDIDRRSDLFSLGVTLYWLLTAQKPFTGRTDILTLRALLEHEPPPPSTVNPKLPKAVDAIVLKLLKKDPAQRYDTARDLHRDLLKLMPPAAAVHALCAKFVVDVETMVDPPEGTQVMIRPTVPSSCLIELEQEKAPTKNSRALIAALAVVGVAAVAGAVVALMPMVRARGGAPPPPPPPSAAAPESAAPPVSAVEGVPASAAADALAAPESAIDEPEPVRERAASNKHKVELAGPSEVSWKIGRGSSGNAVVELPISQKKITATHKRRRSTHEIEIIDGRADFSSLATGTLPVWLPPVGGEVFVGDERAGEAPLPPLKLPVGRYTISAKSGDKTEQKSVTISAGENLPLRFFVDP